LARLGLKCLERSQITGRMNIALLRAVNVGGTGRLPMADLKSMCSDAGFARVETYISSGNVVFESKATPSRVKTELETRLLAYAGNQ
jgi:uncharacterized protein (DUF1697 family)